ncbi:MAG: methyl-accepting chemotaxis protein [Proteobacteria bacterium]|nr:methyl-accepting chemotaxis protein [Pseudomonadota bacterium]
MILMDIFGSLVPKRFGENTEAANRARLVVGIIVTLIAAGTIFSSVYFAMGHPIGAVSILVGAILFIVVLFQMRLTGSLLIIGNEVAAIMFLIQLSLSVTTGGVLAPNTMWLTTVPVLAIILNGVRYGIIWIGIVMLAIVAMFVGNLLGIEFPVLADLNQDKLTLYQTLIVTGLVFFIGSFCLIFEIIRSKAMNVSEKLRVEAVESADSLKKTTDDLQLMKSRRDKMIKELADTIEHINVGAQSLSQSAQSLSRGSASQAASIEEVSSSMNEIEAQTKANNEHADQAMQLSQQALDTVDRGNKQMEAMQQAMSRIANTSNDVSKIIKDIDEIAFQTNLLALNAAVEAARAGKHGKGFAVVAEEVRNLSERSAVAAKNTAQLIENSIQEVNNGVSNSDQTATILDEILESVKASNSLVGSIYQASTEQNSGIEQVNTALSQVNEIAQQNTAISEETASASEKLTDQSTKLDQMAKEL